MKYQNEKRPKRRFCYSIVFTDCTTRKKLIQQVGWYVAAVFGDLGEDGFVQPDVHLG